jgi:hypothetical protein
MMENTQPPPPAYQNSAPKPGQTYYQPPNTPDATGYAPPPPINQQPAGMGQRFTQFYTPPQNKKLGIRRRVCSIICCCIIIGLIIGLSVGLTRSSYYYYGYYNGCNWQVYILYVSLSIIMY